MKIRFLNYTEESEGSVYLCDVSMNEDKTLKLAFKEEIPANEVLTTGFDIINDTNEIISEEYHEYTTIYRRFDDELTIFLSNNGHVYKEIPEPEYEEIVAYVPTTLEEIKNDKISEFSQICHNCIEVGTDVQIGDTVEHFSYKDEDEKNIKELFDIVRETNLPTFYHSDTHGCKSYTADQIIAIYIGNATNKQHHTTYFNQMREYIKSLDNIEDVKSLVYGQELTGVHLQTYNESMMQAQLNLEALLAKRAAVLSLKE